MDSQSKEIQLQAKKRLSEETLGKILRKLSADLAFELGEVLINAEIIEESAFLRLLAKKNHTQYLTEKKLSELMVPNNILEMIPKKLAKLHNVFPVQYRKDSKNLIIVCTLPKKAKAINKIKKLNDNINVSVLVAMPDAIKRTIAYWYDGDENAFKKVA